MYKKILIATDGSELAERGLRHGLGLAKALGAAVTVLTASEPTVVVGTGAGMAWTTSAEVMDELIKANKEHGTSILAAARTTANAEGVKIETLYLPDRYAGDAIVETAENGGFDLIVMASHGRRGMSRLLLGSQASEVLSHSSVPVLIVK